MTAPLISIIIPTFNRANLIGVTLASVRIQVYTNFECIIVDDHSTDHTVEVIEALLASDDRFKYLKNQFSKGAPGARNTGLKYAKGAYITFLDSDDIFLANALQNRINTFINTPDLDLVVSNQALLKNNKVGCLVNIPTKKSPLIRFYNLYPKPDIPWTCSNTLIKRKFLVKNNILWQENLERYQDIQFNLSILLANPKYQWLSHETDSYWVINEDQTSIGKDVNNYALKLIAILEIYLNSLQLIKVKFNRYHEMIIQQLKAFCCYSYFDLRHKDDAVNLYQFIKERKIFNRIDTYLLGIYHQHNSFLFKKIVRLNFKLKLYPALREGFFLKIPN